MALGLPLLRIWAEQLRFIGAFVGMREPRRAGDFSSGLIWWRFEV
jgi:hypothetical protein